MKEKILMICYKRPYPLESGAEVRMFQYIEVLKEYYQVDVIYLSKKNDEKDYLNEICNDVITVRRKKFEIFKMLINYVVHGMPLQVGQLYYKKMLMWLHKHCKEYKYIFCFHIKMASYAVYLSNICKKDNIYFDGADAITLQMYNAYKVNKGRKKILYWIEYKKMKKYEKKVFEIVNHTILISERDKDYIINEVKAVCCPKIISNYAIDLGYKDNIKRENNIISFMGKMDYNPNVKAVLYFVENIYKKVRERYPNLQFDIIGGHATDQILALDGVDGITVQGYVDNPAYYLQRSTLVIAPMRSGAGLQNKIIQAMYLGCVVVTSKIGANGLTELKGDELIIYQDDSEFVDQLIYFLSDQALSQREKIGKNARDYIEKLYSYKAVKKQIVDNLFKYKKSLATTYYTLS